MVEQSGQIGIGRLVIDDEAGVDGDGPAAQRQLACIGVAAETPLAFVEGHVVIAREKPRAGEPGDAGPDYRKLLTDLSGGSRSIHHEFSCKGADGSVTWRVARRFTGSIQKLRRTVSLDEGDQPCSCSQAPPLSPD